MAALLKKFEYNIFMVDVGVLVLLYINFTKPWLDILGPDYIVLVSMPLATLCSQIFLPMYGRYMRRRHGIPTKEAAALVCVQFVFTALFYTAPVVCAYLIHSENLHSARYYFAFILLASAWSTLWFLLSLLKAPLLSRHPAFGKIFFYAYSILMLLAPDFYYIPSRYEDATYGMTFALAIEIPLLALSALIGTPLLARRIKRTSPVLSFCKKILLTFCVFLSLSFSYTFTRACTNLFYFRRWNKEVPIIEKYFVLIALIAAVVFLIALCIPMKKRLKRCDKIQTF